jgi:galactonate dehydratase
MKVTNVRTAVLGTAWRNLTYVIVETDEGISGVGEARMLGHTDALLGFLAEAVPRHVIGHDPFAHELLVRRFTRDDYARPGQIAMSALATIEMACWDIVGKALGQPVYRLLGGPVRDRIPAYANGWYTVEREPDDFHAAAKRVVARGYRALKLDPFGGGWMRLERAEHRRAIALVEAVRDAIGPDADLYIEMHGRFTADQAIAIARDLEPFDPGWIEEPVVPGDLKGLARVAARVNMPIATGERVHVRDEFAPLLEGRLADVLQPDIGHCGGILETRKILAWAESYGVLGAPHNVAGPVATAANLHLAAATPNFLVQEHFNDFADAEVKDAAPGLPTVSDGAFSLPEGPGLGVTLDEEAIARYPRRGAHFDLYEGDWHLRGNATG